MKRSKRLTMVALGTFAGVLLVEITLRCAGMVYGILNKPPEKSKTEYSVFCLGESTTWGIGATSPLEQGYPAQLEAMLASYCKDKRPRCFFDQTIGQNSSEILMKLPRYLRDYDPDLLIVMVGANNWWNMRKTNPLLFNNNQAISRTTFRIFSILDNFRIWNVIKRSGIGPSIYESRWDYFWPKGKSVSGYHAEVVEEYGDELWKMLYEITLHDLKEMIRLAADNNVKTIIASYPMSGDETWVAQKAAVDRSDCLFVDNFKVFQDLENPGLYLSGDGWHPNELGYTIVAKNLFSCIVENGLMDCGSVLPGHGERGGFASD